ncbi:MAG: flagellin [Phycisphaeraceae bacterium]|nr:flagellin [Phycisphaeraceae bacterium]
MSRINTNVSSLIAQNQLNRSQADMKTRLERLSTGLAINSGKDDPAGLIVSERMRAEINNVGQAIDNAERASNVLATAEASLQEVNSLLTDMKALIVEAASTGGSSKEEREANQTQIDSAIDSITRIANTASFAGLKLLNGSLDYRTSGVATSAFADVRIYNAQFGTRTSIPVEVEVLNSAEKATLFISTGAANFAGVNTTIEIKGLRGTEDLQIHSSMSMQNFVDAINAVKDATGLSASLYNGANQASGVVIHSMDYGSESFVSFGYSDGTGFRTFTGKAGTELKEDKGADVLALVNGRLALGDGLKVMLRSTTLNIEMALTEGMANTLNTSKSFSITGGGALYQIGPSVNSQQQVSLGIQSVAATRLGNAIVGYLTSLRTGGDKALNTQQFTEASQIVDEAIDQITVLRGRLGAFERNTLQTAARSQSVALENLSAAQSQIRDADYAAETAALNRAQILVSAGTSSLALANSSAQQVLSLLQNL